LELLFGALKSFINPIGKAPRTSKGSGSYQ
jgi:hypothetical protein